MSQLKIKNGNNWESIPAGGIGVPSGGTTGQVLQKSSGTDYATEWATPQYARPTTLTRPLQADQTTDWTFTAPYSGILYAMVRSQGRKYIGCLWNTNAIGGLASDGSNDMLNFQVICKSGDTVKLEGLDTTHYVVAAATAFISLE